MVEEQFADPVVSVIVERKDSSQILLQRREKSEPILLNGLLELPQGRLRRGESLAACARRELLEETGLSNLRLRASVNRIGLRGESLESILALVSTETGYHSYLAICVVGVADGKPRGSNESGTPTWYSRSSVAELLKKDQVFPLNVPMLYWYLDKQLR